MSQPNVTFTPVDALAEKRERMRQAIVQQIITGVRMVHNGDDVGCYFIPLRPFLAVGAG